MEVRGRKKMKPVVKWMEEVLTKHNIESGMNISTIVEEKKLRGHDIDDETSKMAGSRNDDASIQMKYNRLRDAGKAAMLALENSFFIGIPVLEAERYDAALKWVNALAASFPVEGNRMAMTKLVDAVKQQKSWSYTEWNTLIEKWRPTARETSFPSDLFDSRGDEASEWAHDYAKHQVKRIREILEAKRYDGGYSTVHEIFFGCEECRQHFMDANPENLVEELAASDANGPHAVVMWAWKMHNSVNKRLQRDQWPSKSDCFSCYIDIGGPLSIGMSLIHEDGMMAYLTSVYSHEDKTLFDEIMLTTAYSFPAQGFSAIMGATLFFALVAVVLKTQRHRFLTSKESGHMA